MIPGQGAASSRAQPPALRPAAVNQLPIDDALPEIRAALRVGNVVVRAAPGAGKTTRVPPALLDLVPGRVVVLEPRRVAARAAASRIAHERGSTVGEEVGWQVRFDRRAGPATRLVFATEGTLLRQVLADPLLEGISAVVLDEVHERSVDLDLCLALLREVQRDVRPDLRLVAMSATVDPTPFAAWLSAPVVDVAGRLFPVDRIYDRFDDDRRLADRVAAAVIEALACTDGAVLAFLPGASEIRWTAERLTQVGVPVLPLYGALEGAGQDAALRGGRRVVLATNVAETSVTVEGVRSVVDGGFVKRLHADPTTGLERLDTERVSVSAADQRAGRAGRLGPGRCRRLWSERVQRALDPQDVPELHRADLLGPVLSICSWGADPSRFAWFDSPPQRAVDTAVDGLRALGLLGISGLTEAGRIVAGWPLHPRLGRLLLEATARGAPVAGAWAAALLGGRDAGRSREPEADSPSDLFDRVEEARRGRCTSDQRREAEALIRLVRGRPSPSDDDPDALGQAVLAAWADRVAKRREPGSARGLMVGGRGVKLGPGSAVRTAPLFCCLDVDDAGAEATVRIASGVRPEWLTTTTDVELDFDDERVNARRRTRWRGLVLAEFPAEAEPRAAAKRLAAEARTRLARVVPTDGAYADLQGRLAFVARHRPDSGLISVDPLDLLEDLCTGLRSLGELRAANWCGAVHDRLGWDGQRLLETLAPDRIDLPSGRSAHIDWTGDRPVLAVKMQHLFGLTETPTVAGGRVPLLLQLLGPNGRPQQVTDDLAGFWERTWPQVRKELRGRYPRHKWPEDPRTA